MIYADNASTTRVCKRAIEAMLPFLEDKYGNPSAPNLLGAEALRELSMFRKRLSELLNAHSREIIFTSGGTESNNQALDIGAAFGRSSNRKRILISEIEHSSVYKKAQSLGGFEIVTLKVDAQGRVLSEDAERLIDGNTALVSVMTANNELGTIQPIAEIAGICKKAGALLHTDAVAAAGHIELDVKALGVDMLSVSAHKFGGIKGSGALYVKEGIACESLLIGGDQERLRRAGTEALPIIAAMTAALEDSVTDLSEKQKKAAELRDLFETSISDMPDVIINGKGAERLSGHSNISFKGKNSDSLLLRLDSHGICASKGSACHSGQEAPSRVLTAIGLKDEYALGSLRFSFDHKNTKEEIEYIVSILKRL